MEKKTTIDLYIKDRKELEDIKYDIKIETGKTLTNVQLMKLIVAFLKEKKEEFKEYLKRNLYSQGNSSGS